MVREQTRRFAVACLAAAVVVLVDQATKAAALGGLSQEERIPLLGDLLGLQLAFNPGAILSSEPGSPGCSLSSGSVPWCCWSSPPRGRGPDGGRWGSA
jgi:lipoprotein signal peptidase